MEIKKITLMVVNQDEVSDKEIKALIERVKYPNWCMQPEVMEIKTTNVNWSDDHPLNITGTCKSEFERLFNKDNKELPEFKDIKDILGMPIFRCGSLARELRVVGHDIPCKAEEEQAYVIYFFLELWKKHGDAFYQEFCNYMAREIKKLKAEREGR